MQPTNNGELILSQLSELIQQRKKQNSQDSYVCQLYHQGQDQILKKVSEEATETILASKQGDIKNIIHETADLWFHSLVLLGYHDINIDQVLQELQRRSGVSGLEEKASR